VTTGLDIAVLRTGAVLTPVLLTAALWLAGAGPRCRGAAVLATLWNLVGLLVVNALAVAAGAWTFGTTGAMWAGVPVDVVFGWALLWGAVPILLTPWLHPALCAAILVVFDALVMGSLAPLVHLAPSWWLGEIAAVALCLVPGVLLGVLTDRGVWLRARVVMQVVLFAAIAGFLLPTIAFAATGRSWAAVRADFGGPVDLVLVQLAALPAVVAVAAVAAFARAGGTPYPWDPPPRLVTGGPYAYVANPMQLCGVAILALAAVILRSPEIAGIAVLAAAFGAGLAAWSEHGDLADRFGDDWRRYRASVRDWLPRWSPSPRREPARLYVAGGCEPCSRLGSWLAARRPVALQIQDAASHHPPLRRLRYVAAGGTVADGTRALGAALEHLNLGWAVAGWLLRTPGVGWFVQLVADAVGAGPRAAS
jgi:protein-S-isoprenylcysteine O-methyltransferase Ste14